MTDQRPTQIVKSHAELLFMDVEQKKGEIEKILPRHMNVERFVMQVKQALRASAAVAACSRGSVIKAVMDAAELGLDPSGRLGSAYIVPYKETATLIPGYRGLIDLAVRSGVVKKMEAHLVHWKDEFDYELGDKPSLHHKPWRPTSPEENALDIWDGPPEKILRAAYAVAELHTGQRQFEVMLYPDLAKIRARSAGARSGKSPWNNKDDQWQMYRKCPIRRICKFIALSSENAALLAKAIEIEDEAEKDVTPDETVRGTTAKTLKEKLREEAVDAEVVSEPPPGALKEDPDYRGPKS